MKEIGRKKNKILIRVILTTVVFNCTPFFLLDDMVKRDKRNKEDLGREEKHKKN
jgi:hypothetical protein